MHAIQTKNLTRRFGDFTAVNNVSLTVEKGEVFGFLGPNGSGKTTVIKMLTGILPITEGEGWIEGLDVRAQAGAVRERIGYMSQKFSLYDDLSVIENLRFYGRAYQLKGKALNKKIDETIAANKLEKYVNRLAGRLSGGWKQRLALGCALMHEPTVLFLDEPTAGIDPVARRQLWDLLFQLSGQGITFFVTTHYMDEAERCSHLAYIYYGELIADGTPDSLRSLPEVNPAGTHRFEISAPAITTVLRKAQEMALFKSATIFGRSIHALVDESVGEEELNHELRGHGIDFEGIRPLIPTLEDAFVELSQRRQAQMEAAL
ncbi:MAG TPA: ABC transporter ATP-binding protein [Terriglobales bacterium]|nr:ABC transporter ATP-binding protein [Terriglobales bacterium]